MNFKRINKQETIGSTGWLLCVSILCFSLSGCMIVVDERAVPKEGKSVPCCKKQSL